MYSNEEVNVNYYEYLLLLTQGCFCKHFYKMLLHIRICNLYKFIAMFEISRNFES